MSNQRSAPNRFQSLLATAASHLLQSLKDNSASFRILGKTDSARQKFNDEDDDKTAYTKANPTSELSESELQEQRIQLKLLVKQKNYLELAARASNCSDEELSMIAVHGLADFEEYDFKANPHAYRTQVLLLEKIARGYSKSAIKALKVLFNKVNKVAARNLFIERLEQEHWQYMVLNGLTVPVDILLLATEIDKQFSSEICRDVFQMLWLTLQKSLNSRISMIGEVLGDPEPLGFRYNHSQTEITENIKLTALELADKFPAKDRERILLYAAQDYNEIVSKEATRRLIAYWSTPEGQSPEGLECSGMLRLADNLKIAAIALNFDWKKESEATESEIQTQLAEANRLRAELNSAMDSMQGSQIKRLKFDLEQTERQIQSLAQRRSGCLQKLVNLLCRAMDIPEAVVEFNEHSLLCASYQVGTGRIAVSRELLLSQNPLSDNLLSTLVHELVHMEQDVTTIRLICDSIDLTFGKHAGDLNSLMQLYSKAVGYPPEPIFLLATMRKRDDRRLTAKERQRAERLYQGSMEAAQIHERTVRLEARLEKIDKARARLESGDSDNELLSCLLDQKGMARLFRNGRVPAILLNELEETRLDLEAVVTSFSIKIEAGKAESLVQGAHTLIRQGYGRHLEPVKMRIKTVLVQVLKEEQRRLNKALVVSRRQGYHEEEAYYIDDRTQVLVRCLEKEWLKPQ